MEGLDFLGVDEIGHGGGHGGGGRHGGGWGGRRGGDPNWGWYGAAPIVIVEDTPFDEVEAYQRYAMLGDDAKVNAAQAALKSAGFKGADGKPLKVDGIMGPNTEYAITSFWASRGTDLHLPTVDDDLLNALGVVGKPSDARPAKGWSQPQPNAMGPAVTPDSQPEDSKKKWYVIAAGAAAVAIGVALFAFGGK
jgi:hypothetical protein